MARYAVYVLATNIPSFFKAPICEDFARLGVDVAYYYVDRSFSKMAGCVNAVLDRGALLVLVTDEHSNTFSIVRGFTRFDQFDIVHFDAHLDWIEHVEGIRNGRAHESDTAVVAAGMRIFTRQGEPGANA